MYLILSDANGNRYEGVIIAGGIDRMRVAFRGGEDAVELMRRQNRWISDDCRPVELESIVVGNRPLNALEIPEQYQMAG